MDTSVHREERPLDVQARPAGATVNLHFNGAAALLGQLGLLSVSDPVSLAFFNPLTFSAVE